MKHIFFLFFTVAFFGSCQQNSIEQIRAHAIYFYTGYKGDFRSTDKFVFTNSFAALLEEAAKVEKDEVKKTKEGPYPDDKPRILEGDLLCGLYEGFNKYEVQSIRDLGNEAIVTMELKNTNYNFNWSDTLYMIKEDGWKIDDIRFGKKQGTAGSSREIFTQYIDFIDIID